MREGSDNPFPSCQVIQCRLIGSAEIVARLVQTNLQIVSGYEAGQVNTLIRQTRFLDLLDLVVVGTRDL